MKKEWRWMLVGAVAVTLTVAASVAGPTQGTSGSPAEVGDHAASLNLTDVQVDTLSANSTEIALVVHGEVAYESLTLENPDRFVVDLHGVVSRLDRYRYDVDNGGVVSVRAAQHGLEPLPVTRVVFDLDGPRVPTIERRDSSLVLVFHDTAVDQAALPDPAPVDDLVREMEARLPDTDEPSEPAVSAVTDRAVGQDLIDQLLDTPSYAAPSPPEGGGRAAMPTSFETKRIGSVGIRYSGKEISLNLVDADLKQIFRLFHEISGLNFVLDPSVSGRVTIVLDQVPWDQALDIILKNNGLDKVLENNVIRIATTQKLAQEAASRKQLREAEELEVEPITITRTLSYAKARDVERVIRESGVLTSRGKAIVDERTNTLIISDIPKKFEAVDALVTTLDAETPQVMIEARIVETSRDFSQDLGVVWGAQAIANASRGTSTGVQGIHNAAVRYGLNLPGEGQASTLAFKFGNVIDSFTLDVALNTLETEGYGRILSSPKIATQNNERAEIEQGTRIPVTNTTATEINVEFVSASLKLMVTPQITAEGTIILDVIVENNSADFVNTSGGVPSIRTQRAQTKVMINDGGTTVIGGIFTVNEGESEIGVPWFRKVPVFGWLFKSHSIDRQNRELLIFITPKIMRMT
jgi:type IV pilus assembly protein PilQ